MAAQRRAGATRRLPQTQQTVDWPQRIRVMLALMTVLALIGGGYYLHDDDTLPVRHVTIEGDIRHTDRDVLQQAVRPYVKGSFVDVDVAAIRRVTQALPWIESIQVRRVWPDTLHLVVTEHQAVARWNKAGLVSHRGQVFYPEANTLPTGLVHLYGPTGSSEMMSRRLVAMQRDLNGIGLKIKSLHMDKRRSWAMTFQNSLQLRLGRANSEARLQRFIKVYAAQLTDYQAQIAVIDMRYTNGMAVQWKPDQKPDFNGTV
ncbi:Cell division protein FtsQ [Methylophaga frappieri]|uniref:Cell division protein FtsQ n=1 Tax=Methylophaga frappieri (strain ATCC BAA-2434 / DSM 25690 / JAM7) TaxID=754477 RepID=I1YGJ1_METFJ|nr:cell division protein FtsQ/DivIB [Methylophaga frappieri]AFJ02034.1 Cell division protein FtsQ [Methylophaga frappieri]